MADDNAIDAFLERLEQSELVSSDRLPALVAEFRNASTRPESAEKLAEELVRRGVLTTWQADMLLQGKHRGFRLGPYRILKPLGQGGMSKVFLAEHEIMHRRCAIKVLPSKYQEDQDLLSRFHLEAQAIAALDHPNIVRAYDFNKDVRYGKEINYLVMEYVEGPDLRRLVEEQGPLDYRKAADFICQAAEGLAHAHAAGFVHRDIKPANLLVDPHGVLKVLDLGLATFTLEAEQSLHSSDSAPTAVGTADFVAPEQVMDSRSVDGRADIYSLGLTFYFLLTGKRPFSKPTIMELLMAHRTEKPEPISQTRPAVPLDLAAIIDKMTAQSPFARYQSAKELAQKLRAWLNEAGSGRGYSRIAALMAEALRKKQSSADEATEQPAKTAEEIEDFQLAALDDDKTASKEVAAPVEPPPPESSPNEPTEEKAEPVVQPAALPDLLAEDLLAEAPPAEPILTAAPILSAKPVATPIVKSPWLWIGLGAGTLLLLVVVLWIVSTSSTTRTPVVRTETPPSKPAPSLVKPPRPAVVPPPKPIAPSSIVPEQSAPVVEKPAPTKPSQATEPSQPTEPSKPPAQPKPSPEPSPSKPPAKPVDSEKVLANLNAIYYRLQSTDKNLNNPLTLLIRYEAERTAKQLNLAMDPKSRDIMELVLQPTTAKDTFGLQLSAELKHGAAGESVTVWSHSRLIFSGDPKKMHPSPALLKILKENVGRLFNQFEADVRRARKAQGK